MNKVWEGFVSTEKLTTLPNFFFNTKLGAEVRVRVKLIPLCQSGLPRL